MTDRVKGGDEMSLKKHGVGEVIEVEENDLIKKASKQFTEQDEEALARENADADKEG